MANMTINLSNLNEMTQGIYGFSVYYWDTRRGKDSKGESLNLATSPIKIKKHYLPLNIDRIAKYFNSYIVFLLKTRELDKNRIELNIKNPIEGSEFYNLFIFTPEKINTEDFAEEKTAEKKTSENSRKRVRHAFSKLSNRSSNSSKKIPLLRRNSIP